MIEFSLLWLSWWIDITCKALLLGTIASLSILVFRLQDANVRHRVWTGLLCGMCGLPLLVLVTPRVPLPNWLQFTPAVLSVEQAHLDEIVEAPDDTNLSVENMGSAVASTGWSGAELHPGQTELREESITQADGAAAEAVSEAGRFTPSVVSGPPTAIGRESWPFLAVAAVLVQVIVSVFFLVRVITGLLLSRRIIARATPINGSTHAIPKNVLLVQTDELSVPATTGFFSPRILLPCSWIQWQPEKIRSVLLHELAHVRRADWLVNLLSEVNCALHWFNPLAWITRKQLADLAELNCDDAVLEARGDRSVYATHLIEVATELASAGRKYHPPRQSIAMARRALVEVRIDAILDDSRRLARRLGRAGMVALVLLVVPIVLLAAALGPDAGNEAQAQNLNDGSGEKSPNASENANQTDENIQYVYAGLVLNSDGTPAVGAKVQLVYWVVDGTQSIPDEPDAITDSEGRFHFEKSRAEFLESNYFLQPWQSAWLVVTHTGYGLASAPSVAFEQTGQAIADFDATTDFYIKELLTGIRSMSEKQGNTLKLSDEVKLSGKLVDLEGRPVSGVEISFIELFASADDTLDAWLAAATENGAVFDSTWNLLPKRLNGPLARKLISSTKSDSSGSFTIRGLGKNQVVRLATQSPQLVSDAIYCRTNDAKPFSMNAGIFGEVTFFGDKASLVVVPSRPVEGRVFRKETGEAIPGVVVTSQASMLTRGPGDATRTGSEFARAITDAEGKFALYGLPRVNGNTLLFTPPLESHASPRATAVDTSGLDISTVEFEVGLTQGVLVNGRITDQQTSQPINSGQVYYLGASDTSAHVVRMMRDADYTAIGSRPDRDGRFSILVPQGPGYIGFTASNPDYELTHEFPDGFAILINGLSMSQSGPFFHALERIEATAEKPVVDLTMTVHAGKVYDATAVDGLGATIQNGMYLGLTQRPFWQRFDNGTFPITSLRAGEVRAVAVVSEDQKWAGATTVAGDPAEPIVIKTSLAGTLKGRVVSDSGSPLSNVRISGAGAATESNTELPAATSLLIAQTARGDYRTDDEGHFKIKGLVADLRYELSGQAEERFSDQWGNIAADVLLSPGQTVDLGDVQMIKPSRTPNDDSQSALPSGKDAGKDSEKTKSTVAAVGIEAEEKPAAQGAVAAAGHTVTVSGRVVDVEGKSVKGAKLYWPQAMSSRDFSVDQVATTDDDGRFQADLTIPSDKKQLPQPHLVAAADSHGAAWADLTNWVDAPSQGPTQEVRIVLSDEFPVSLRVIDAEGKPLKGVTPQLSSLTHDSSGSLDTFLNGWLVDNRSITQSLHQVSYVAAKVFSLPPSDEDGSLLLRGIGPEQKVTLFLMSPQIATTGLTLLTRPGFVPDKYNEAAIAQVMKFGIPVRNLEKLIGSGAQLVLEPGRSVYGTVTDARTGIPIEGASVEGYTMNRSYDEAKTNSSGEYRINGLSSVDEVITITVKNHNLSYLDFSDSVRQTDDLQPIHFDFKLQPAVVITGHVAESGSGRPVSGSIWLVPLPENNWQENPAFANYRPKYTRAQVDESGNFTLIGVPGAHVIMMQASSELINGEYIRPHRQGSFSAADQSRVRVRGNGKFFYSSKGNELEGFETCMKVIDIPDVALEYSVDLLVERGMEADVDLQDEQGSPLSGVVVGGLSESYPTVLTATDSTVRIYSLDPIDPRRVLFFHQERQLTGEITLRGDEQERPSVRLMPAHHIAGKAVDSAGLPIVNARVTLLWADDIAGEMQRQLHQQYPQEVTDKEGNFKVCAPFPSKMRLLFTVNNQDYRAKNLIDTEQFPPIAAQRENVVELGEIPATVRAK